MTSEDAAGAINVGASVKAGGLPFDPSVAHQARMYDYMLGGKDNFAVDRAATEAAYAIWPDMASAALANRAFLGRMIRYLSAEAGVRQFLDIGTGIPTAGNTHHVAQALDPESRVVYVDYDPVVLAHARALLGGSPAGATSYIDADLRDTGTILDQADQLLDLTKPVAVTLISILHAVSDSDDPQAIVATLMGAVPPGSYLAVTHAGSDLLEPETLESLKDAWRGKMQQEVTWRNYEQVLRLFDGTELVKPGLVRPEEWRPEPGAGDGPKSAYWAGVGRKR